jgi:hypothetical protein
MANKLHDIFVKNGSTIKMNEEGPEMVCTYNGGEVKGKDAAELLKLLSYSSGFNMSSTGFSAWSASKPNTVELIAEEVVDTALCRSDPAGMDEYIRTTLARKLADAILKEDLIEIQSDFCIDTNEQKFRAKLKIVQE